jgi:Mrp family chromosome partitioning ATPase
MSKNSTLLQKMGRDLGLFQTSDRPSTLLENVEVQQTPTREIVHQEVQRPELPPREVVLQVARQLAPVTQSSQIRPAGVLKEKIRTFAQEVPKRIKHRNSLETIRYREEVKLVQRIFPPNAQGTPQIVLFSSLENEADACSITARSAEMLAARSEGPVCAVDVNLRSPFLHRYFGIENGRGLSDAILEPGPIQDCAVHLSKSDVWVIPAGSAVARLSAPELSKRLRSRMMELRTLFKYVVVSSPLYLDRAPAPHSLAADGVVLIVEANATRRETVREVMEELQVVGARVLGVVLNNRTFPIPDAIYRNL